MRDKDRKSLDNYVRELNKRSDETNNRLNNLESIEPPVAGGFGYIVIVDEKTIGTGGGTFTTGAWQTRDLNTERVDTGGYASVAANQITLVAGTYRVYASAPAFRVAQHQTRLQNITAGTTLVVGTSEFGTAAAGENEQTRSILIGRFVLAVDSVIELQHNCGSTRATDGFGSAAGFTTEVYSIVELWKE